MENSMTTSLKPGRADAVRRRNGRPLFYLYVVSIVLGLAIWQAVARHYPGFVLATPLAVLARLADMIQSGALPRAFAGAVQHMALGFAISIAVAFPVGLAMGRVRALHDMLDPVVNLVYAVPAVAWAPLIMIWFGLYFEARVALVVLMCTLDMLIVVSEGSRSIDLRLLAVGRSFGAGSWRNARLVLLPASTPFLFAALRIGVVRAVNAMITAELFLATVNLGAIMKQASVRFDSAAVLGILFLMSLLGLLLQELLLLAEQRMGRWMQRV